MGGGLADRPLVPLRRAASLRRHAVWRHASEGTIPLAHSGTARCSCETNFRTNGSAHT